MEKPDPGIPVQVQIPVRYLCKAKGPPGYNLSYFRFDLSLPNPTPAGASKIGKAKPPRMVCREFYKFILGEGRKRV